MKASDPICGMMVDEASALRAEHNGQAYFFCSDHCRQEFLSTPAATASTKDDSKPVPTLSSEPKPHAEHWKPKRSVRDYLPLIVIVGVAVLAATASQYAQGICDGKNWMRQFMGIFLVIFAMFKLFDLPGFADGFQKYDLIAKRYRPYALVYPFIELALGLAYLAHFNSVATNFALVIVMTIGTLGVLTALQKGLDVACACLGTVLKVPLSTVAVVEDVGMAVMAAIMLFTGTR